MAERLSGCLQHGICELDFSVQMRRCWQGTKRPCAALLVAVNMLVTVAGIMCPKLLYECPNLKPLRSWPFHAHFTSLCSVLRAQACSVAAIGRLGPWPRHATGVNMWVSYVDNPKGGTQQVAKPSIVDGLYYVGV